MPAAYPYQIIFQAEPELNEWLRFGEANSRPHMTRSAICRAALYKYLIQEYPEFLKPVSVVAAE
jgi:hypothetical protein